ncbi:MAG: hypothetical protein AVDCRST_MAG77-5352 [uncultured Chloroflexi bacterium]|uniref:Uncharacterized protein n=1 Tax=uncultured Chloroflexota bacterium TaxID=166587 RepID=A0A6J4K7E4_9CHLR|nr:MAG: hypothetical protein AVDCRST_MAG77-5352 [uncultured Chloroflexota bacterium]
MPRKTPITVTLVIDPAEMSRRGRIGAYVRHSRHDAGETAARARAGLQRRFEREVDPIGVLPAVELACRVEEAKRAYFSRISRSRRSKSSGRAPPS